MNDLWIETGSISMNKHGETLCGDKVELQTIDFAEFERRFLASP